MSIIYEALKKAESREGKKINNSGLVKDLPLKGEKISRIMNKKKIKPASVILLLILFSGLFFLWNPFNIQFQKLPFFSNLNRKKNNLEKFSNFLKTNDKTSLEYILNGIVYDNEKSSAVINGRIIKKGDKINNFIVNDISSKTVKLMNNSSGKEIILSFPF